MHIKYIIRNTVLIAISSLSLQSVAAGNVSYSQLSTVDAEPDYEINKGDLSAEYSIPVYASADHRSGVALGAAVQSTSITFDSAGVDDLDLVKIKFPVTGNNVLESGKLVSWSLVPGLHGEADALSDADARIEGQAMVIIPSDSLKWVLGAGFGEQFGKPQAYPVFGAIWNSTPETQWTVMFPMVMYEHTATPKMKYRVALVPDGAQWSWEADALAANTDQADVSMSGIKLSGGFDWALSDTNTLSFDAGWVTEREFEVTNHIDANRNETVDLEDAWFLKVGWLFK